PDIAAPSLRHGQPSHAEVIVTSTGPRRRYLRPGRPMAAPRRLVTRVAARAIRRPRGNGRDSRRRRRGLDATRAAVRRTTWGLAVAGVRRAAAVRRTVRAIRGNARMAAGPPRRTKVRAA